MGVNLASAWVLDGEQALSQEHIAIAAEIADRYENLKLIWVPVAARTAEDTQPFAIVDMRNGNVIKQFSEITIRDAVRWLWENDSQRVDTYKKHEEEKLRLKQSVRDAVTEQEDAKAEVAAGILGSKLHTVRHDGLIYSDSGIERVRRDYY